MATSPVKRRITVYYDIAEALIAAATTAAQVVVLPSSSSSSFKRIRRMPHLFDRVIELPVDTDAPVRIEESVSAFTFTTLLPNPHLLRNEEIRAEIIEIVPGVTKVSVSGIYRPSDSSYLAENLSSNLNTVHRNLDTAAHRRDLQNAPLWRFRLPEDSIPQDSVATCDSDGILVLTVPKKSNSLSSGPSLLEAYQQVRRPLSIPSSSSDSEEVEIDIGGSSSLHDLEPLVHEKVLDNEEEDDDDTSVQSPNEFDESQNPNDKASFDESQTQNENDSSHKLQALNGKACDRSRNLHEKDFPDVLRIPNEKSFHDESLRAPGEKASSDVELFQTLNEKVFSDGLALDDEPEMVIAISACGLATEVDTR